MPRPDDALAPLDLDAQPLDLAGERLGVGGQRARRQIVAGSVLQVAGGVDGARHERRLGNCLAQVGRAGEDQSLKRLRRCAGVLRGSGLVLIEAVVGEHRALDQRAGDLGVESSGACQHSATVDSSRARPRTAAATTRARSGVKRSRLPSPTSSQRLPSA